MQRFRGILLPFLEHLRRGEVIRVNCLANFLNRGSELALLAEGKAVPLSAELAHVGRVLAPPLRDAAVHLLHRALEVLLELVGELLALEESLIRAVERVGRGRVWQQVVCNVRGRGGRTLIVVLLILECRVMRGRVQGILRQEVDRGRVKNLVLDVS